MTFIAQELNRKIVFQEMSITQDPDTGEIIEAWADIGEAFAKVEPLVGREFLAAAAIQSEGLVKFTLRYREGLNTAMRLIFDGGPWNMTSIQNIKSANRELLIYAKRI